MTIPSLTVVQLQCFVLVVDSGSFARAARRLGLSTSSVSKTILRMEEMRGVRLLNRSTHSLSLTPEGEELIGLAREALHGLEAVDHAMAATAREGSRGRVRISMTAPILSAWLAPLLPAFHAAHPDIFLDLRTSDLMVDLAREGVDLAIRGVKADGIPGHLHQVLFRFRGMACASAGYLAARGTPETVAELADHDLIGFRNKRTGAIDPWQFRDPAHRDEEFRWTPDPAIVVDDGNGAMEAVVAGAGVAWLTEWMIARHVRSGAVKPILPDWTCRQMEVFLVRRHHARSPARLDQVIAFLTDQAARMGGEPHDVPQPRAMISEDKRRVA